MTPIDSTFAPVRSRFDYGIGGSTATLEFQLPARAWDNREDAIGGRRIAAGGVGASFVVRRDEIIVLRLRFRESEWPSVLAFLHWGQAEETFIWYPDANELLTSFTVYLHSPAMGTSIVPNRLGDFPKVMELAIELRRVDLPETPFGLDYYGNL